MQTIARTNRVYGGKTNGLIVDYVNVFANLRKALAIYGSTPEMKDVENTIKDKASLHGDLESWLTLVQQYSDAHKLNLFDLAWVQNIGDELTRIAEIVVSDIESSKEFLKLCNTTIGYYNALLPQPIADDIVAKIKIIKLIVPVIRNAQGDQVDISKIKNDLEDLLNRSISVEEYAINENFKITDLSKIDYDSLKAQFMENKQHTIINQITKSLEEKLATMVTINPKRFYLIEKLNKLITEYNLGSKTIQETFEELMQYCKELDQEEQRSVQMWLDEESLALFDIIVQAKAELSKEDEKKIKLVAQELLGKIKEIVEWSVNRFENTTMKSIVQTNIYSYLYESLPASYQESDVDILKDQVFNYAIEHYSYTDHKELLYN